MASSSSLSLADQLAAKRNKLSSTITRVRQRDGSLFEERRNDDGTISTLSAGHEALPAFLTDAAAGFSRLQAKIWQSHTGENKSRWVPLTTATLPASTTTTATATAAPPRIVTYNVWFKDWYQLARAHALFDIIHHCNADIIGFQEVTSPFLTAFLSLPWIRDHYIVSDSEGTSVYPYGVLLAVHRRMITSAADILFTLHALPSNMSRRFARVCIGNGCGADTPTATSSESKLLPQWAVGTVHLESLANRELRCEQLRAILPLLNSRVALHSCLTGDFNFDDGARGAIIGGTQEAEQLVLDDIKHDPLNVAMMDCWVKLRPSEAGSSGDERMGRYDRVLVRSTVYQPATIEQLGTIPIANLILDEANKAVTTPSPTAAAITPPPRVFPSDHYGLLATFRAT